MKKLLACALTIVLMLNSLTSCSLFTYKKNQWFSEEKLTECIVPDMPQLDSEFLKERDKIIYANLSETEFNDYLNEIYGYLKSKNFEHLGTRGEEASSLSGAFVTYYLEPATELSQFNIHSNTYKFVYSDGQISMSIDEDSDDFTFCILTIGHYESTQTIEYGIRKFDYNTTISLKFNSEAPLSGRYTLKDDHEHTYQNYHDDIGHGWSYTCGCKTPPNFAQHFDGDGDQKCDDCGYDMVIHASLHEYACWLLKLEAEEVAEVKTTFEYVGVAPGRFKDISITTDKTIIADVLEKYAYTSMKSVTREETDVDGGSAFTIEFILTDGTAKKFNFNNGFYAYGLDQDEISALCYFELDFIPTLEGYYNVEKCNGLVTYIDTGKVCEINGKLIGEIPLNELEFVKLTEPFEDSSTEQKYHIETEFGNLAFFSDTVFYIYFSGQGHTDFYQLIGKNLDQLIAEYSATEE